MRDNKWARLLAYVTSLVNQRLLLQCEYLIAENRILRSHVSGKIRLSDPERCTLAEIGKRLGRKHLKEMACVAKPETILGWYRRLIARKFDGSKRRSYPGRPRVDSAIEGLIVQLAQENSSWGYDRSAGALANLGHNVSDQTIGNVLKRHGIAPAPKRSQSTTWKDFISAHMAVLAGTDFFTIEVLTWRGLATYYVLFFLHLETRRVTLGGFTRHPTEAWMTQMARNAVDDNSGTLRQCRYVLHDRDTKYCSAFDDVLASEGLHCLKLPRRSPDLNAFAERWVRSVKEECLSKLILFGERSLQRATIRARVTCYSSLLRRRRHLDLPSAVITVSAGCFGTTAGPLEYFDLTGAVRVAHRRAIIQGRGCRRHARAGTDQAAGFRPRSGTGAKAPGAMLGERSEAEAARHRGRP